GDRFVEPGGVEARPELGGDVAYTAPATAGVAPTGAAPTAFAPTTTFEGGVAAPVTAPTAAPWPLPQAPVASGTVFGVDRRLPRGIFLWPSGVIAALDLQAQLPEGASASTIAALEILAAGAVADMASLVTPSWGMPSSETPSIDEVTG